MLLPPPGSLCWSAHSSRQETSRTVAQIRPCFPWNQKENNLLGYPKLSCDVSPKMIHESENDSRRRCSSYNIFMCSQWNSTIVLNFGSKKDFYCCSPADGCPGLLQTIHCVGLQGRQDGPQGGEILQLSAFLQKRNTGQSSFVLPHKMFIYFT